MAKIDPQLIPPTPTLDVEQSLWAAGYLHIAGIDEAGRGPVAGPVAAAAVILPQDPTIANQLYGVRDSKQMSPQQRQIWLAKIKERAQTYGVGFASAQEIDVLGIAPATRLAISRALESLTVTPDYLLIDYIKLPEFSIPQTSMVKGDARSLSIAAASVLAKTARDAVLTEMDNLYPGYYFASHKGYGTVQHLQALERLGPSPIHRLTFNPLRERMQG